MLEYRRRLPHFHPDDAYLFVTWRLYGSLPAAPLDVTYPTPGHAFAAKDRALAQGHGRRWLSDPRVAQQVVEIIRAGESEKRFYELQAWAVMPNHVHILILPHVALPRITHGSREERPTRRIRCWGARGSRFGRMSLTITG